MLKEICISGFGGQGVLAIGKTIVEAAMEEDINITWAPSYGPEMRGGTANCSVVLSNDAIGSPIFDYPTELIAMNLPSLIKFEPKVQAGGIIFVNSSVVSEKVTREDVKAYYVPCTEIAEELGNSKVANMVMVGAYVAATGAVKPETVNHMIEEMFAGRKAKMIPINKEAFARGMALID